MLLTIGADPEFVIGTSPAPQDFVRAEDFFPNDGPLGIDGAGGIVEIRPRPSADILEVLESVILIMQAADQLVPEDLEFYAGAHVCGRPIGGHIHLGGFFVTHPAKPLVIKNLDIVSRGFINSIEPADQIRRRRSLGYGRLSQYRSQDHGIEYRSPLSWLLSPAVTLMYLGYAKLALVAGVKGINFEEIPGAVRPGIKFLKNLPNAVPGMPMDCMYAMEAAQQLLVARPRMDWTVDMRPNWKEQTEVPNANTPVPEVPAVVPQQQPLASSTAPPLPDVPRQRNTGTRRT